MSAPGLLEPTSPLRASFYTLGCRLNQAETAMIANRFEKQGYQLVPFGERADVCVINSCTVTAQADAKCRHLVRRILRENAETVVAIVGCYAEIGAQALADIEGIDLIVGTADKLRVLDFIGDEPIKRAEPQIVRARMTRQPFTIDNDGVSPETTRANLKIQDGCDFMCSFCVIPRARGRARSRRFDDVRQEAQSLIALGHRELVLTGVNIGTYRCDGYDFVDLVQMLCDLDEVGRVRISSIEPTTVDARLLRLMRDQPALCAHLHLPLQSASDTVLQRMKRKYGWPEFEAYVMDAVASVPGIQIATDLIVGFPGESDAEFAEMADRFANSPIAYAHIFSYSARPGTAAHKLPDHVDPTPKKVRSRLLHDISRRKRQQFAERFIGQTCRVLTEEQDEQGAWLGYSDNYLRVCVAHKSLAHNQFVQVKLIGAEAGVAFGELLA